MLFRYRFQASKKRAQRVKTSTAADFFINEIFSTSHKTVSFVYTALYIQLLLFREEKEKTLEHTPARIRVDFRPKN